MTKDDDENRTSSATATSTEATATSSPTPKKECEEEERGEGEADKGSSSAADADADADASAPTPTPPTPGKDVQSETSTAAAALVSASATSPSSSPAPRAAAAPLKKSSPATPAPLDPAIERKWDHTSRKVIVSNVLKFLRKQEVPKLVARLLKGAEDDIKVVATKKPPSSNFLSLTLETSEMVELFLRKFGEEERYNKKGGIMEAHRATTDRHNQGQDGRDGRNGGKRGRGDEEHEGSPKRQRIAKPLTPSEVRDAILPLWSKPYHLQLLDKYRDMSRKSCVPMIKSVKSKFRNLEKEARSGRRGRPPPVYPWLNKQVRLHNVLGSGSVVGYRNKVELTFGYKDVMVEVKKEEEQGEGEEEGEGEGIDKKEEAEDVKMEEGDDSKETKGGAKKEGSDEKTEDEKENVSKEGNDDGNKKEEDKKDVKKEEEGSAVATKDGSTKKEEEASAEPSETPSSKRVPSLGFLPRGWRHSVSPPHLLPNVPKHFCSVAQTIEKFLSTSPIPPYDSKVHRGVWRQCTMRSSVRTGEIMVVICHAPPGGTVGKRECGSDDYGKVWEGERDRLVQMLKECEVDCGEVRTEDYPDLLGDEPVKAGDRGRIVHPRGERPAAAEKMRITSIFFQEFSGLSNPKPDDPVQHMFGKKHLTEKLGQCSFRISPGAFFQVTTEGAEVLYDVVVDKVKEVAGDKADKALLLDVCCGTGTIGLYCMKEGAGGRVVGVDIAEPAIEDAKVNAVENGFAQKGAAKFVASRAEKVLHREIASLERDPSNRDVPIIAIVDPAREGLHGDVVRTLRQCDRINRLIYVSCNPTGSLVKDAALLCGPPTKKYGGVPFEPTGATPVDMFPLTSHCEMVVTFDRLKETEEEDGEEEKKEEEKKDGGEEKAEEKKEVAKDEKGDEPSDKKEEEGVKKEEPAEKKEEEGGKKAETPTEKKEDEGVKKEEPAEKEEEEEKKKS